MKGSSPMRKRQSSKKGGGTSVINSKRNSSSSMSRRRANGTLQPQLKVHIPDDHGGTESLPSRRRTPATGLLHRSNFKPEDVLLREITRTLGNFKVQIRNLAEEWKNVKEQLESSFPERWDETIVWKNLFRDDRLKQLMMPLYAFRRNLVSVLMQVCKQPRNAVKPCLGAAETKVDIECQDFGSTNIDSDIDVTIKSNCLVTNVITLRVILEIIESVFESDSFFGNASYNNASLPLENVLQLLDVNFYLSEMALLKNRSVPLTSVDERDLKKYILSTDYALSAAASAYDDTTSSPTTKTMKMRRRSQFDYAFYEWSTKKGIEQAAVLNPQYTTQYMFALSIQKKIEHVYLMNNHTALDSSQKEFNDIIRLISELTLTQPECYHTQGAYFHVVLNRQKGIDFPASIQKNDTSTRNIWINMLMASCIENLCFALNHHERRQKYMMRVSDALRLIQDSRRAGGFVIPTLVEKHVCPLVAATSANQKQRQSESNNRNDDIIDATLSVLYKALVVDSRSQSSSMRTTGRGTAGGR